jgi:formyl-CoA transferase
MRLPVGMGDHSSATSFYAAIVTALYKRERTGRGGLVGSSLLMNGYWTNASSIQMSICGEKVERPPERIDFPTPLRNSYQCSDGKWLLLTVINTDERFAVFRKVLQSPLLDDARFLSIEGRAENRRALTQALDIILASKPAAEWNKLLDSNGIAAGVVTPVAETWKDEQAVLAGAVVPIEGTSMLTISSPFWMQDDDKKAPTVAPTIGQHSDEVLIAAGFSTDEIQRLREEKIVR